MVVAIRRFEISNKSCNSFVPHDSKFVELDEGIRRICEIHVTRLHV